MAIAEFEESGDYDLQDEVDRKVLDAIEKLTMRYDTGQITEAQLGESLMTLYTAFFGLTTDKSLQEIVDAYEPLVTSPCVYFEKMRKLDNLVFVIWRVDTDFIEVHSAHTGDVKHYNIPLKFSAHEFYNRILTMMTDKGWSQVNNEDEVNE